MYLEIMFVFLIKIPVSVIKIHGIIRLSEIMKKGEIKYEQYFSQNQCKKI